MNEWILKYLGKGYQRGADGPDAFDCWSLVKAIYQDELGLDLPSYDSELSTLGITHAMGLNHDGRYGFRDVTGQDYGNFDIVLLKRGSFAHHAGILVYADKWCLLHAVSGVGVILTDLNFLAQSQLTIQRAYRHDQALRLHCMG